MPLFSVGMSKNKWLMTAAGKTLSSPRFDVKEQKRRVSNVTSVHVIKYCPTQLSLVWGTIWPRLYRSRGSSLLNCRSLNEIRDLQLLLEGERVLKVFKVWKRASQVQAWFGKHDWVVSMFHLHNSLSPRNCLINYNFYRKQQNNHDS